MNFKTYSLIFGFGFLCYCSQAQIIKQAVSAKKGLGIKVDGKLDDWKASDWKDDKVTRLSYALANDDKYLYLAIRKDKNAIKINKGGLSFILVDGKNELNFTYPMVESGKVEQDLISLRGIPSIQDSVISVYNEYGINAAMVSETETDGPVYTMEFAIPFKNIQEVIPAQLKVLNFIIRLKGNNNSAMARLLSSSTMDNQSLIRKEDLIDLFSVTEMKGIYQIVIKSK
ncbi:hypothetical protein [Pedobacter sp.]|uniref:hypothetical protein n=1 Tax=Pedobacter sp. TaxID=1411316 RepID=UPI002C724553|nr:hypothetical protein [Pedobacter sp.]HWW41930.1 hypothetical protein [Pedobacter sp.]